MSRFLALRFPTSALRFSFAFFISKFCWSKPGTSEIRNRVGIRNSDELKPEIRIRLTLDESLVIAPLHRFRVA